MMDKLSELEVFCLDDEPIFIEHKTKGSWLDHSCRRE